MARRPSKVRNGTEQRGTVMKQKNLLVIGTLEMRSNNFQNHNYNVTVAANYEEAIELLTIQKFDFVITDADAPCKKCCLDLLRHIKSHFNDKEFPFMYVCHSQRKLQIRGIDWFIVPSLKAFYSFATFFEGTMWACMNQVLLPQQKRA